MTTSFDLKIKGSIEVLHVEPGDKIVVTLERPIPHERVAEIKEQVEAVFPDNEVVLVNDLSFKVVRSGSDSPWGETTKVGRIGA